MNLNAAHSLWIPGALNFKPNVLLRRLHLAEQLDIKDFSDINGRN